MSALFGIESTVHAVDEAPTSASDHAASGASRPRASRYQHRAVLGQGGMGVVDHVWDEDLMRDLAVKRLRLELRGRSGMLRQFLWEARVTAHLDHPNVVPVHELGVATDGQLYFTMKKVEGQSLERLIRAAQTEGAADVSLSRRLLIFAQICQALEYAHARGVLHRDLKPANIMLGSHGEVVVMDWGLAIALPGPAGERLASFAPPATTEGSISGTPLYMSPEQARGEPLDERSDIYTLGAILYELAAFVRPYEGADVAEISARVRAGDAIPFERACPTAPSSLAAVIARAMAARREDRYPTAAALRDDVALVIEGRTPSVEPASLVRRVGRFYAARNPGLEHMRVVDFEILMAAATAFGAGVATVLAGGSAVIGWTLAAFAIAIGIAPTVRFVRRQRASARSPRFDE